MITASENLEISEKLDSLRRSDNTTNLFYIARAWLVIFIAAGGFILFDLWRVQNGLSTFWDLPLLKVAVIVIGASQHQLAGAGHEGTHFTLFRNRRMNELLSDWLCMFPILTSTAIYRKQHLAHHKHVNDPEQDPDLVQLHASRHDFDFPLGPREAVRLFSRQLWIPNLIRYTIHRARYSAVGTESRLSRNSLPQLLYFPYFFMLLATLGFLAHLEVSPIFFCLATAALAGIFWVATCVTEKFVGQKSKSAEPTGDRPARKNLQRFIHVTILLLSLTLFHSYTGLESLVYFVVLWLVPLVTSFSFFMMLRQTIQHGNCDEGRYSNTRVFLVNPILRYAVFPFGMDYHLPHHLYASVPHYRLHELHELLSEQPAYRHPGFMTKGVIASPFPSKTAPDSPTLIAALGPEYTPSKTNL